MPVPRLDWLVFVEQPLSDTLIPMFDTIKRLGSVFMIELILAVVVDILLVGGHGLVGRLGTRASDRRSV